MIHKNNIFACPLHSLASYVLVARVSDELFPDIGREGAARITNAMLNGLREAVLSRKRRKLNSESPSPSTFVDEEEGIEEEKAYTSHSLRSGAATFLSVFLCHQLAANHLLSK